MELEKEKSEEYFKDKNNMIDDQMEVWQQKG